MEGDRGVITKKDSSAEPSLLDDGPLPLIPAQTPHLRGMCIPGENGQAFHPALLRLMPLVDKLFGNQTNPNGAPTNPALERSLQHECAVLLDQIAREDSSPLNREVARLRREWFYSDNPRERDELTRRVAEEFIRQPPETGYVFDAGFLCNEAALQRHVPRSEGQRYSGWLLTRDPRGDETISSMLSPSEVNLRLPESIRPKTPLVLGTTPPLRYWAFHSVRLAGEAARGEHVATFFPEDQGTPPKGRKWTAIFSNVNRHRFQTITLPLWMQRANPADVATLLDKSDAEHERSVICVTRGHELGHFSGPVPLNLKGYPGFEGFRYPIFEELRADATWLFSSRHASRVLPDEIAWRDHQRVFLAEMLRYVSRGLTRRADSISALLSLNFLRAREAIRIDGDLRLSLEFDHLQPAIEELVVRSTQIIQVGDGSAAEAFCAEFNYDLPNRCLKHPDPFVEKLLDPTPV
jgi:hypothetical protein